MVDFMDNPTKVDDNWGYPYDLGNHHDLAKFKDSLVAFDKRTRRPASPFESRWVFQLIEVVFHPKYV